VEIGSWKGRSTICLGKGAKETKGARICAIDPHTGSREHQRKFGRLDTFEEFIRNIENAGLKDYISPIRKTSEEAAKDFHKPIGFLFIDGAHEFRLVRLDIKLWFNEIVNGGIIAFHDSWGWRGPNLATALMLLVSRRIKNPRLVDTITYCQKVKKNSLRDRLNNIAFLFYRSFFGWIGAIRLSQSGHIAG